MKKGNIRVQTPAKINFTLEILGQFADGYHEVETILQSIALCDFIDLHLEESKDFSCSIKLNDKTDKVIGKGFPLDENNLLYKAANLFLNHFKKSNQSKTNLNIQFTLEKNIPLSAGLAGGSGNAAGVLLALNEFFENPFTDNELESLAGLLGADVPFSLRGGLCHGSKRGDLLQPIINNLALNLLIIKPKAISVSTPWAFSQYDQFTENTVHKKEAEHTRNLISFLQTANGNINDLTKFFYNDFEAVILKEIPQLSAIKKTLLEAGALSCHLSGSGPSLFALTRDASHAQSLYAQLNTHASLKDCHLFLTSTLNHGCKLQ